tara:strand:- start:328 stop:504 length:177 start_codon:yes stop_codon:yes gene_type:complete
MQFSKISSTGNNKRILIKVILLIVIVISGLIMISKIDFPSPNKEINKVIPNEKLKIVK